MADDVLRVSGRDRRGPIREWARLVAEQTSVVFGRVPSLAIDLTLAAGILVAMVVNRVADAGNLGDHFLGALLLSVTISGALVARRSAPLASYVVGTAGLIVETIWLGPADLSPFANLIGLYSLGQYASRNHALLGPVLFLPAVLAYFAPQPSVSPAVPIGVLFIWLLAWGTGYSAARQRERAEGHRRLLRRQAIIDERVRIARELHDVIGHTMNAMLMQAGAGRMVLDTDPARARALLTSVEQTGRNAMAELDRVLDVLRADDEDHPGLDNLDQIVQPMVDAGLAIDVQIEPSPTSLPRSIELSAFRIVQESLTNALRHGRARSAAVTIAVHDGVVAIEVSDDGRGPGPGYQPGRGLLGITERVAVFGGSVRHGPGATGGFTVHAELPLP